MKRQLKTAETNMLCRDKRGRRYRQSWNEKPCLICDKNMDLVEYRERFNEIWSCFWCRNEFIRDREKKTWLIRKITYGRAMQFLPFNPEDI